MSLTISTLSVKIPVEIECHNDGRYIAASIILPGCIAVGRDVESALARFRFAAEDWIADTIVRADLSRRLADRNSEPSTK